MLTREQYRAALVARHGLPEQQKIEKATVGIAGLGGLGSNIAFFLARLGIGRLILADFDNVDISNLNRQQYRVCDLGKPKTQALAEQLTAINPYCVYQTHTVRITEQNIAALFSGCTVLCEAFDRSDQKAMLAESVLYQLPQISLVAASGMAGTASANSIRTVRRMKNFYLCGDSVSDINEGTGLTAPRVAVCAAHQATMVLRLILGETEP